MYKEWEIDKAYKEREIDKGLKLMVKQAKKKFGVPENIDHYSEDNYKKALKKYIKLCVLNGKCK